MQLITSPLSPFVRKVRVLIREAGKQAEVEERPVSTTVFEPDPQALSANPTGKIPALIRDDGPTVFDSRVICRYLDAKWQVGLYPESRIWEVLTLEALADAITEAALAVAYERRFRDEDKRSAPWMEGQWRKVAGGLDALEDRWMSHLTGPLTMAQIAVGCALGYVDLRLPEKNWRVGRPQLAAWEAKLAERPAMQETKPVV